MGMKWVRISEAARATRDAAQVMEEERRSTNAARAMASKWQNTPRIATPGSAVDEEYDTMPSHLSVDEGTPTSWARRVAERWMDRPADLGRSLEVADYVAEEESAD